MAMLGLTTSELGIVLFLFLIVVVAARLPRFGETLGSFFYKRSASAKSDGVERARDSSSDESNSRGKGGRQSTPPAER